MANIKTLKDLTKIEAQGNIPTRIHATDAGYDLTSSEDFTLVAGERYLASTGTRINIPEGYVGFICPRSGLAANKGVTVLNAPGVVDAGYTGEILVNLINTGSLARGISKGDRIAQLVILPIVTPEFEEVDSFDKTERGGKGYGSSGE